MKKYEGIECTAQIRPVRDALDVISGKWKLPIIIAMSKGNMRFREIQRAVDGISPKVLSSELKVMEMNLLVERKVNSESPSDVAYHLTPYSRSLGTVIHALQNWGEEHRRRIFEEA